MELVEWREWTFRLVVMAIVVDFVLMGLQISINVDWSIIVLIEWVNRLVYLIDLVVLMIVIMFDWVVMYFESQLILIPK